MRLQLQTDLFCEVHVCRYAWAWAERRIHKARDIEIMQETPGNQTRHCGRGSNSDLAQLFRDVIHLWLILLNLVPFPNSGSKAKSRTDACSGGLCHARRGRK
jgi:hypothetical protein